MTSYEPQKFQKFHQKHNRLASKTDDQPKRKIVRAYWQCTTEMFYKGYNPDNKFTQSDWFVSEIKEFSSYEEARQYITLIDRSIGWKKRFLLNRVRVVK